MTICNGFKTILKDFNIASNSTHVLPSINLQIYQIKKNENDAACPKIVQHCL